LFEVSENCNSKVKAKRLIKEAEMYQKLRTSFEQYTKLTDEEFDSIKNEMTLKSFNKGDYFVKSGQLCKHIGFLVNGISRVYYLEDGKEITSYFNYQDRNPLVSSFVSFLTNEPSYENIHIIEDAEMLIISKESLDKLYESSNNIQKLGRLMAEHNYVLSMERIYSLQHQSAQQRYELLLKTYPNLLNTIPHHYIASYLGVTPESMSRIRKSIAGS